MRISDWSSDVCSSDLVPATTYQGMKFPDAPWGLKMACGENPKRVYGEKGGPSTRMGNVAGYRAAFIDAAEYRRKRESKGDGDDNKDNKRDLKWETLAETGREHD